MTSEYMEWIRKSEKDLEAAKYNLTGGLLEEGAFFLQQSAEKSLKALFIKKTGKFPRIHDLVSLAKDIKAPEEIIASARILSPAYHYTRYPDVVKVENLKERIDELEESAEKILKWVKKNL